MRPRLALVLALALSISIAACGDPLDSRLTWPDFGGVERFAAQAFPVLESRCAHPGCHGNAQRPFALFAPRRHRLDPAATHRMTPLTDEEMRLNFWQTTAFLLDTQSAEASLLLRLPVHPAGHGGVFVFPDRDDYGYRTLHAWIQFALDDAPTSP